MKKSENWTAPTAAIEHDFFVNNDPMNHGTQGAIKDGVYSFYADVVTPYFDAAKNLGIPINKAASSGNPNGVWTLNAAIDTKNVSRCFSYNGYYLPNSHRSNLVVVTGAQVTKILTKTKKGIVSATGVEYISGNKTFGVNVKKEVILSAGAIQSPQILELSGIGNKALLKRLSIPVVLDLPGVGENYLSSNSFITPDKAKTDSTFAAQQFEAYVQNRTGIYSATSATTLGFLPLNEFLAPAVAASLLRDLDAALPHQPSHLRSQYALQRKWLDDPSVPQIEVVLFAAISGASPEPGKSYYSIALDLQHLWSRGSVHITTADPLTPPNIDGQYLNSVGDFDMKLLIESVKWAQKLSQTEPLKNITLASISLPLNASDDEIRAFIASNGGTEWHFAGTAAMLPRDQNGVVDSKLKVYGTSNIRVVDASILPVVSNSAHSIRCETPDTSS
ncbi:hypothetical protein H0H87_012724 [Tephrocybe sp. NHM501043]|nr:hypothetical protein H0H87_012724 [Tephrocybe sp. NHM501043]